MSTTAKITKIKNKTKSKVLVSGINRFQYLPLVATHAGLMVLLNKNFTVTPEATDHSRIAAFSCINLITDSLQKKFSSIIILCFIHGVMVAHHNFGLDFFLHW